MNKFLLFLAIVGVFTNDISAATGDTTVIVAHTLSNLNSPPSDDDIWVEFPNTATTYQKIIMKFTLGCGTPNCSGWDYTVNASLGKKSGTWDSTVVSIDTLLHDTTWNYSQHVDFMEVGRLITPYGTYMAGNSNGFNNSWTHPFYYDVTDYASVLKDSVNVRVHYDGWSDAFSARVEFVFIEGPPTRTVESVKEIYHLGVGYPNSAGFESVVSAKTFSISPNVTSAKVVIHMTGHGGDGEFDPHYIHLKVNGNEVYSRYLWKDDCDVNPVAPQGGTWIFPRANWCPGDKVPVIEADISPYITPGQNVTLDLDMDDFTPGANGYSYGISSYLVTYTTQKNNDVMMEEIIAPNSDKPYLHWNPICTQPKVKIKNTGKNLLTYAEISYWVEGGNKWYYEWNGALAPFQSELITLPPFDFSGMDTADREFYAEAKWANGVPDEYDYNNKLTSSFNMTPKLDSVFYIFFRTNNHPEENYYIVRNEVGDTISFKSNLVATTTYRDTLRLVEGSYTFDIYDYDNVNWGCGDGISWWLNTQNSLETTGQLKFMKLNNTIIKTFVGDFGGNTHYEFTVGYPLGYNTPKTPPTPPIHNTGIADLVSLAATMNVFPNPANSSINIQIGLNKEAEGIITINDISGRTMREIHTDNSSHHFVTVSASELSKGIYFVNFVANGIKICRKVVVQ